MKKRLCIILHAVTTIKGRNTGENPNYDFLVAARLRDPASTRMADSKREVGILCS